MGLNNMVKYKAFSLETNSWVYGNYLYTKPLSMLPKTLYLGYFDKYEYIYKEVLEDSICRFTGVRSKPTINKKFFGLITNVIEGDEIYEGDIVKEPDGITTWVVKWDKERCGFYLDVKEFKPIIYYDIESSFIPWRGALTEELASKCEIVGNIYENE